MRSLSTELVDSHCSTVSRKSNPYERLSTTTSESRSLLRKTTGLETAASAISATTQMRLMLLNPPSNATTKPSMRETTWSNLSISCMASIGLVFSDPQGHGLNLPFLHIKQGSAFRCLGISVFHSSLQLQLQQSPHMARCSFTAKQQSQYVLCN